jgi:CheY-like chemotaxis protein
MTNAWIMERTKTTFETAKGLRVLLVEDHADCAATTALLLRMDGHDVRVSANGPAALDEAQVIG